MPFPRSEKVVSLKTWPLLHRIGGRTEYPGRFQNGCFYTIPTGQVREFSSSTHSENLVGILKVKFKKVGGVTKIAVPLSFKLSSYSTSVSIYWSGLPCPPPLSQLITVCVPILSPPAGFSTWTPCETRGMGAAHNT